MKATVKIYYVKKLEDRENHVNKFQTEENFRFKKAGYNRIFC